MEEHPRAEQMNTKYCTITNVWKHNLHSSFKIIRQLALTYHWIALDTEFPGEVVELVGHIKDKAYQTVRCNVDLLKIIQLGLTFMDENGNTPPGCSTWQFNFKYDLQKDYHAIKSILLLQDCGLNFKAHHENGIEPSEFGELLMTSGIVLMDNIHWVGFHTVYDFGYLLKILINKELPPKEKDFLDYLKMFFNKIYDIKYIMQDLFPYVQGGLADVATQINVRRTGRQHQAGSDSLLAGKVFFRIKESFFHGNVESSSGHLYGFSAPCQTSADDFQDAIANGNSC